MVTARRMPCPAHTARRAGSAVGAQAALGSHSREVGSKAQSDILGTQLRLGVPMLSALACRLLELVGLLSKLAVPGTCWAPANIRGVTCTYGCGHRDGRGRLAGSSCARGPRSPACARAFWSESPCVVPARAWSPGRLPSGHRQASPAENRDPSRQDGYICPSMSRC